MGILKNGSANHGEGWEEDVPHASGSVRAFLFQDTISAFASVTRRGVDWALLPLGAVERVTARIAAANVP